MALIPGDRPTLPFQMWVMERGGRFFLNQGPGWKVVKVKHTGLFQSLFGAHVIDFTREGSALKGLPVELSCPQGVCVYVNLCVYAHTCMCRKPLVCKHLLLPSA